MVKGINKNLPDYNSPDNLKEILESFGFSMQKKFGQNFLINEKIRAEIISFLDFNAESKLWEVGPGLGAMTSMLMEKGAALTVFEIDKGFSALLNGFFGGNKNFKLVLGDVRKTWREEAEIGKPDIFFGNLPYNISLEFISSVIEADYGIKTMLFTVQKEAAQRIIATKGSKNYTALSVLCKRIYNCRIVKIIPADAFWPQPHVDSAALLFDLKEQSSPDFIDCKNSYLFTSLVKALFASRRKTVKNNLGAWLKQKGFLNLTETILKKANLKENIRAESLSVYDFLVLSDIVSETIGKI